MSGSKKDLQNKKARKTERNSTWSNILSDFSDFTDPLADGQAFRLH